MTAHIVGILFFVLLFEFLYDFKKMFSVLKLLLIKKVVTALCSYGPTIMPTIFAKQKYTEWGGGDSTICRSRSGKIKVQEEL